MSYLEAAEPRCDETQGAVELEIRPRERDLGGFTVRRVLPAAERRAIGPFVFFDEMGPAVFPPGKGIQVRPHPHVCLATITYLFEGQIMHRDSLGYEQPIRPGAVNLMTAGRGIVHSERAGDDLDEDAPLHGIQLWIALPGDEEEREPAFEHVPADALPVVEREGIHATVILGEAYGQRSPVTTYSETLYLDVRLDAGASLDLPETPELAVYVVHGRVYIGGNSCEAGTMAVAAAGCALASRADTDARFIVIGGASLGKRHIWWNFVASRKERIEQAKSDWRAGRFATVPGDDEFIPLPD